MKTLQNLGQIGHITYMYQGEERIDTTERSSGRNIGYKTRKGLLKNMKGSLNRLRSQNLPIVSVKILTVAMIATDVEMLSETDL